MKKQTVKSMKWWGWGSNDKQFDIESAPGFWPYLKNHLDFEATFRTPVVNYMEVKISQPLLNKAFMQIIELELKSDQIVQDDNERLIHAYGKSFRDLWRIRRGIVERAPDCVLYPETEEQISKIVQLAIEHDVVLIPFGGGSNIAGCIEIKNAGTRMCISLDMKRMRTLIELDQYSGVATLQAGVMGPDLEEQLNRRGFTLGHLPDSFEYSTLGGWVATRSAGMQSDRYGKIEDMVISIRMITPQGQLVTRTVPKSSNGIDVNHVCIGSEGTLGVITAVTVAVHKLPEKKDYYGYLFQDFSQGIKAIYECVRQDCLPCVTRLNDPVKTSLSLALKPRSTKKQEFLAKLMKQYLKKVKQFQLDDVCLMIISIEGNKSGFKQQKKKVNQIFSRFGGFCLGTRPGRAFEAAKYDFPYLRDYVMGYNLIADVSETATVWSNIENLYANVKIKLEKAIHDTGFKPLVGCHVSHNYHSGASLYFTFGCEQIVGEELRQYDYIKKSVEDAFIEGGATLSHHHAVGYEHSAWLEKDISSVGVQAVKSLKEGLDPKNIMNPGKILPDHL